MKIRFMAQPTLAQIFGSNSTQDADELIIQKSDLVSVGLTALANNEAEHIFVAMLLKALLELNDAKRDTNPDVSVVISEPNESLITQNNIRYLVKSYTVELYKPEPATATNPMDY